MGEESASIEAMELARQNMVLTYPVTSTLIHPATCEPSDVHTSQRRQRKEVTNVEATGFGELHAELRWPRPPLLAAMVRATVSCPPPLASDRCDPHWQHPSRKDRCTRSISKWSRRIHGNLWEEKIHAVRRRGEAKGSSNASEAAAHTTLREQPCRPDGRRVVKRDQIWKQIRSMAIVAEVDLRGPLTTGRIIQPKSGLVFRCRTQRDGKRGLGIGSGQQPE